MRVGVGAGLLRAVFPGDGVVGLTGRGLPRFSLPRMVKAREGRLGERSALAGGGESVGMALRGAKGKK